MKQHQSRLEEAAQHLHGGRFGKADAVCREILLTHPVDPRALYLMGVVAHRTRKREEAINWLRQSIDINPDNSDAQQYLAMILCEQGDHKAAITHLEKVLAIKPDNELAHYNMGNICYLLGKNDSAIYHFKAAIHCKSDYAAAYHNLGNALYSKGAYAEALAKFSKAASINPSLHEAHINMGLMCHALKQHEKAAACFTRALEIIPDHDNGHFLLGTSCLLLDRNKLAQKHFEKVIELNPYHVAAHCNLGYAFVQQLELDAAMAEFQKTIDMDSECAEAWYGMAKIVSRLGQPDKAIDLLRKALRARQDYVEAYQSLLMHLHYSPTPSPKEIFKEHLAFSAFYEKPLSHARQPHTNSCLAGRKLRIGYVSPDFRRHSVAYFIEPVLSKHDRNRFEILIYHNNSKEDDVSKTFQGLVDKWHNIYNLTDEQVAELVRRDQIDILVDLAGHTFGNRLLVFARRPAPVQVTWIGYPGTTGLSSMDYRITDHCTEPVGSTDKLHTEQLLRLPECFSTYLPPADAPEVCTNLPADKNGFITFGSFNNFSKTNPEVIKRWSEILTLLPSARLVLKHEHLSGKMVQESTRELFQEHGIAHTRLTLLGRKSTYQEHLSCYHDIDIALDTYPYNGTTTTCEALWMGVPVIVLAGVTHVSRVGFSLLKNIGCPELVAEDTRAYTRIAMHLASNRGALSCYRAELRARFAASPLMDSERFTRNLQQQYVAIWENWCATGSNASERET